MGNGKTGGWFNAANLALHAFFTTQTMVVNDDVVEGYNHLPFTYSMADFEYSVPTELFATHSYFP